MGKPTGFMEYPRRKTPWRDPVDRALDYYEIYTPAEEEQLKKQGARCMNCGVPFCESEHGCPIDNLIPEWNDLVYKGKWKEAYERLQRQIIFQSLQEGFAQHLVREHVFWA